MGSKQVKFHSMYKWTIFFFQNLNQKNWISVLKTQSLKLFKETLLCQIKSFIFFPFLPKTF